MRAGKVAGRSCATCLLLGPRAPDGRSLRHHGPRARVCAGLPPLLLAQRSLRRARSVAVSSADAGCRLPDPPLSGGSVSSAGTDLLRSLRAPSGSTGGSDLHGDSRRSPALGTAPRGCQRLALLRRRLSLGPRGLRNSDREPHPPARLGPRDSLAAPPPNRRPSDGP